MCLVPVVGVGTSGRATDGRHALTTLVRVEETLDQTGGSHAPFLRIPVDPVAQLLAHFDRRRHDGEYTKWDTARCQVRPRPGIRRPVLRGVRAHPG